MLVIAIGLITGIINRSRAFSGIGIIVLGALFWPFFQSFYKNLPFWLNVVIFIFISLALVRGFLTLLFGRGSTDHFLGEWLFTISLLPFRLAGYLFKSLTRRK